MNKIFIRQVGEIWLHMKPLKWRLRAPIARVWAKPKTFLLIPGKGLGVYKSTLEFWYWGSLGALRTHIQFYYIEIGSNFQVL